MIFIVSFVSIPDRGSQQCFTPTCLNQHTLQPAHWHNKHQIHCKFHASHCPNSVKSQLMPGSLKFSVWKLQLIFLWTFCLLSPVLYILRWSDLPTYSIFIYLCGFWYLTDQINNENWKLNIFTTAPSPANIITEIKQWFREILNLWNRWSCQSQTG